MSRGGPRPSGLASLTLALLCAARTASGQASDDAAALGAAAPTSVERSVEEDAAAADALETPSAPKGEPDAPAAPAAPAPPEPAESADASLEAGALESRPDAAALEAQGALAANCDLTEIAYVLERVEVRGNLRTRAAAVASFVPVEIGGFLDVDDPQIEALRYRLLGTGWFDSVQTSLERGSRQGQVVLVIQVEERNTLVIKKLAAGVGWSVGNVRSGNNKAGRESQPYLGVSLADMNFLGTGREAGLEFLVARNQQGLQLEYLEPLFDVPSWSLFARTMFTRGQEYFGGDHTLAAVNCDPSLIGPDEVADCQTEPPAAVLDYWRAGWHLGGRREVGMFTHVSVGYRGDFVRVPPGKMPSAASTVRGRGGDPLSRTPIDFAIEPGSSYVSAATFGLTFDKRDSVALPTSGTLTSVAGDFASSLIGSDYEFVRLQLTYQRWRKLPWGHVLRGGAYWGSTFGNAPFFYKFFVSDLTDLAPSRILGLNLDHRPAPNIFGLMGSGRAFDDASGTSIAQMRIENLAGRVDAEYIWPFKRGGDGFLKSGDMFVLLGLYMLADPSDLRSGVPGYNGISRIPLDLTFDVGVRLDTEIGVLRFGFSKLAWLFVTGPTVD